MKKHIKFNDNGYDYLIINDVEDIDYSDIIGEEYLKSSHQWLLFDFEGCHFHQYNHMANPNEEPYRSKIVSNEQYVDALMDYGFMEQYTIENPVLFEKKNNINFII